MLATDSFIRVFHKIAEIDDNANIGITGFTMWKQKYLTTKCYRSEDWIWDISHLDVILSSLGAQGMSYLGDLRSLYGHALLVLTKWSESKIEVVQEQKTILGYPSDVCLDPGFPRG